MATSNHVYLIVDPDVHERAIKALRHQERLASTERGLVRSLRDFGLMSNRSTLGAAERTCFAVTEFCLNSPDLRHDEPPISCVG